MTDLENAVVTALRLSEKASERLLPTISRHIETAKLELERLGIDKKIATSANKLVEDAIITFCLMKMTDGKESHEEAFKYQSDCIRKSTKGIS